MCNKIVTILLVLVMALSFSSCTKEPSAEEIADRAVTAQEEIRTYQFELDMTMDTTMDAGGETYEENVTMKTDGALDLENQQLKFIMAVDAADEGAGGGELYIIDGMMYSKVGLAGEEAMWTKGEIPPDGWERMTEVSGYASYQKLLETAQVEVTGSEKVNGVDCYVLQLTPDMAQLARTATDPAGGMGAGGRLPPIPEEFCEDIFSSYSVKQWIAKDDYFLMKVELDAAIESTPEIMDFLGEEGEISIDITIVYLAYDFNESASTKLPPEAENAIEM
jgi:hypothetical protein